MSKLIKRYLCGDSIPFIGYINARRAHYSDVQQLNSLYNQAGHDENGEIAKCFLEHSGLYQGEEINRIDQFNLDDTVYTHMKLFFDGGYYIVVLYEKIESLHNIMGPYFE